MSNKNQAGNAPERVISVDLNAADPAKAVERHASADIARGVRDGNDTDPVPRTKAERDLYKRMGRLERSLEKQFDQRMANREAEWQRERSELQQRLDKVALDRGGDDPADAAHDAAINALKDKLAAAYEKGDSAASADITLQISKLDAQYWAKKATAAGVVQRDTPAAGARPAQGAPQAKGPTIAGSRFIRANAEWWEDPEFAVEVGAANTIYLDLVNKDGFDPKDDETFKEVAKQLKAKFPTLAVRAGRPDPEADDADLDPDANDAGQQRQVRRQAPAGRFEDRGGQGPVSRSNKRTLTEEETKTMRDCRLDPDNDRDVVQFLREAVALEAAAS